MESVRLENEIFAGVEISRPPLNDEIFTQAQAGTLAVIETTCHARLFSLDAKIETSAGFKINCKCAMSALFIYFV